MELIIIGPDNPAPHFADLKISHSLMKWRFAPRNTIKASLYASGSLIWYAASNLTTAVTKVQVPNVLAERGVTWSGVPE